MPEQESGRRSAADALERWRRAERASAVARHGRLAAELAVGVASEAALAANATAEASKSALESARLAEASASRTAQLARDLAAVTVTDLADAQGTEALADFSEAEAQGAYRQIARDVAARAEIA